MLLSFTIPCYRSENTVRNVINEIIEKVAERNQYDYEIICANDASPDNTWQVLKEISAENQRIKVIDLSKNSGKHAALMACFSQVNGDIVIGVDDDGQCPIDRLWDLIAPVEQGADMAMALYPKKVQSGIKNIGSAFNDFMVRFLIGKPKGLVFSNFIARKRFVCEEIIRYKNPYPYLEGLTLRITHNIAQVPMEERKRQYGSSGYTFRKSLELWLNGCTAFSVKPLRLATMIGFFCSFLGFCMSIYVSVEMFLHKTVAISATLAAIVLIGGIIMVLLGMIGEYVGRIYMCINNAPQYVIRDKINCN